MGRPNNKKSTSNYEKREKHRYLDTYEEAELNRWSISKDYSLFMYDYGILNLYLEIH